MFSINEIKVPYYSSPIIEQRHGFIICFQEACIFSSLSFTFVSFHKTLFLLASKQRENQQKRTYYRILLTILKRESTFAADRWNGLGKFVRRQLRVGIAVIFATRRMQLKAVVALTYHRVCKFLIPKVFDCNSGPKKTVYVPITSPLDKVMSSRASRSIS